MLRSLFETEGGGLDAAALISWATGSRHSGSTRPQSTSPNHWRQSPLFFTFLGKRRRSLADHCFPAPPPICYVVVSPDPPETRPLIHPNHPLPHAQYPGLFHRLRFDRTPVPRHFCSKRFSYFSKKVSRARDSAVAAGVTAPTLDCAYSDGAFSLLPSWSLNLTKLRIQRDLNAL